MHSPSRPVVPTSSFISSTIFVRAKQTLLTTHPTTSLPAVKISHGAWREIPTAFGPLLSLSHFASKLRPRASSSRALRTSTRLTGTTFFLTAPGAPNTCRMSSPFSALWARPAFPHSATTSPSPASQAVPADHLRAAARSPSAWTATWTLRSPTASSGT